MAYNIVPGVQTVQCNGALDDGSLVHLLNVGAVMVDNVVVIIQM